MAEQSVDLRSTVSILRRHRWVLLLAVLVGVVSGVGLVVLRPPLYASSTQVLLPPVKSTDGLPPSRDVKTEMKIATSDGVLGPAGQAVHPALTVRQMAKRVTVKAPTSDVLEISGRAADPDYARTIAQAAAEAEVAYVTRSSSSLTNAELAALRGREDDLRRSLDTVGTEIEKTKTRMARESNGSDQGQADAAALAQLTAQQASLVLQIDQLKTKASASRPDGAATIIQTASPAKRPNLVGRAIGYSLLGVLLAELAAASVLVLLGRRDRKLRYRDEIADALGSPVVASVRSRAPRTVADWASLLEEYTPGTVDAWAMRQALHQLDHAGAIIERLHGDRDEGSSGEPLVLSVISLADDPRALAMGPQLAAYAAASGITTTLVAAQRHESAAALWAACAQVPREVRPGLRIETRPKVPADAELSVVLMVVDRRQPELAVLPEASVPILAVSSGAATAEELALVAVTADDAGGPVAAIVVVDPDDLDRTTGRLLQHERAQQVPLPARLTGLPGPATASGGHVSGLRGGPR